MYGSAPFLNFTSFSVRSHRGSLRTPPCCYNHDCCTVFCLLSRGKHDMSGWVLTTMSVCLPAISTVLEKQKCLHRRILPHDEQSVTEWGATMLKYDKEFFLYKNRITFLQFTSNSITTLHFYCWMVDWWGGTIVHLITYLFPSSASLSLSSIAETIINYPYPCYPSLNLSPSSRSIQESGSLWLLAGHPTPLPCQSTQLRETDSSVCKSIIIFRQCNPIPEDIRLRTNNALFLWRTFCLIQHRNAAISGSRQEKINLQACRPTVVTWLSQRLRSSPVMNELIYVATFIYLQPLFC